MVLVANGNITSGHSDKEVKAVSVEPSKPGGALAQEPPPLPPRRAAARRNPGLEGSPNIIYALQ